MRILYLFPGPLSATGGGREELTRRENVLKGWAAPDTTVEVRDTTMAGGVPHGPVSFETGYEAYLTVANTVPAFVAAEKSGYDAGILGCFGDPGLDAVRENLTGLPVVGPGAAACYMASMLGERFGIITTSRLFMTPCRRMLSILGLENRAAGIEVIDAPPRELARDFAQTRRRIGDAAEKLQREGADVLVLGCMSMGFMNVTDDLQAELGLPVVNPVRAALHMAETVVRSNLRPSKIAYPKPEGAIL